MKSLSEEEKYILALVEMDLDKLNDLGGENIMDEYVKEAEEVSFEGGVGEAYDKEWALRDQGYRDGLSQGKVEGKAEGKAACSGSVVLIREDEIRIRTEGCGLFPQCRKICGY